MIETMTVTVEAAMRMMMKTSASRLRIVNGIVVDTTLMIENIRGALNIAIAATLKNATGNGKEATVVTVAIPTMTIDVVAMGPRIGIELETLGAVIYEGLSMPIISKFFTAVVLLSLIGLQNSKLMLLERHFFPHSILV